MNKDYDKEVIVLCEALNKLPGIRTIESCYGHGSKPYRIWFLAKDLESLPALLYYFDGCHCGFYGWKVIATTDCAMSPVHFMIEGPSGKEAHEESEKIAECIEEYLKEEESK